METLLEVHYLVHYLEGVTGVGIGSLLGGAGKELEELPQKEHLKVQKPLLKQQKEQQVELQVEQGCRFTSPCNGIRSPCCYFYGFFSDANSFVGGISNLST
jgi:hypothetical protein